MSIKMAMFMAVSMFFRRNGHCIIGMSRQKSGFGVGFREYSLNNIVIAPQVEYNIFYQKSGSDNFLLSVYRTNGGKYNKWLLILSF